MPPVWPQNRQDVARGTVTHDFATAMTTAEGGGGTNAGPMFGNPVDMDKSMQRLRVCLGFSTGLELVLERDDNLLNPVDMDKSM